MLGLNELNFEELMPVLHNYVMIDTNAFLSEPTRLEVVFKMIKQVIKIFEKYLRVKKFYLKPEVFLCIHLAVSKFNMLCNIVFV